ncbi:hypothetical protein [Sphingomonas immobilis]|uniref:STAS/SEC14 domain-containing protein n=1 Tax=Sphingomonas immobilis TaxID=3063997 RepID=A0ABT9A3D2_9SPHN|nr:hypothetical protein [Sphingomonas sp. CA1-15]MDO7844315.1 hypothetical protein [Sphingomonas sp. CA1-15]
METIRHLNPDRHTNGELSTVYDPQSGVFQALSSGFLCVDQSTAFFAEWKRAVQDVHSAGLAVTALVDLSDSTAQSPEVVEIIINTTRGLYRPGDAIAMMVPTSIAKIQMRRALDPEYHEFFVSRFAAESWLRERDADRAVPMMRRAAGLYH